MDESTESIPIGRFPVTTDKLIQTTAELGQVARERRQELALTQLDGAGLSNTGNRFSC